MPKFAETPIHRKTRGVQFAAGGLQIAQTFPLVEFKFELKLEFPLPQVHLAHLSHAPCSLSFNGWKIMTKLSMSYHMLCICKASSVVFLLV